MAASDTIPPALRASDADRDRAIQVLQQGSADGRLSHDSFLRRLDIALHTRHAGELAALLRDLSPSRVPFPARLATRWSRWSTQVLAAWRTPRLPALVLPHGGRDVFTIGRATHSDLVLPDLTVSWQHAELRRSGDAWLLVDLGSTNGTRANGWRVGPGLEVRPGDCVTFGRCRFRLTGQPGD
jgi:FHA domain-containing protein/uncharacterized protein DUF1707